MLSALQAVYLRAVAAMENRSCMVLEREAGGGGGARAALCPAKSLWLTVVEVVWADSVVGLGEGGLPLPFDSDDDHNESASSFFISFVSTTLPSASWCACMLNITRNTAAVATNFIIIIF